MLISKTLLLAVTAAISLPPLALAQAAPAANPPQAPAAPAKPLIAPPPATPAPPPRPEYSGVSIRVEQPSKTESEKEKKTVTRSLKIFVTNSANEPVELKLKFALYAREAAEKEVRALGEGDRPASVKARSTEIVETNTATAVMTEAKYDKGKRVPPSGMRFVGYGVQAFKGEKLVAEVFDPPALKDSWGKAPTGAAPKPKPAKAEGKPGGLGL